VINYELVPENTVALSEKKLRKMTNTPECSKDPFVLPGLSFLGALWIWASSHFDIASGRDVWVNGVACFYIDDTAGERTSLL
jgi:hypothetical protein